MVKPILRWPGGKAWLANQIVPVLECELNGHYIEPFLGGGAIYLSLQAANGLLSDANAELVQFYLSCCSDPSKVIAAARRFPNNEASYYAVRQSSPTSEFGRAGRFLFLNKTCWGGVYRLNRQGKFNVPYGKEGRTICRSREVTAAAASFREAEIKCLDFEDAIRNATSGDVVFADPPYTAKGQFNGFVRYNERIFSWSDQIRLSRSAKGARRRGAFVAVCGSYHRDILGLYKGWWVSLTPRKSRVAGSTLSRATVFECVLFSRKPADSTMVVNRVTDSLISGIPYVE